MTITIFGTSRSRAFRVLWAAKELEIPFDHNPIDWQSCGKDPSYLAVNPAGSVPCLQEGDFVLSESLAINLYLAQRFGGLWPNTEHGQAASLQWTLWAATSLEEPCERWALHERWLPKDRRRPEVAQAAMSDLRRPLARLELALCDSPWLVEDRFTIADLNVAAVGSVLNGLPPAEWPSTSRWLSACLQRPAFKDVARLP
jgi:glutathione S-transferase